MEITERPTTGIHPYHKNAKDHSKKQIKQIADKRSSEIDDIVLDAFGGSGSTMIACEQLGRSARIIELDAKFVDAIVTRWCQYKNDQTIIKNGISIQWLV